MGIHIHLKGHRKGKVGGGGRSAEDYGVPDMTDAQLKELASNPYKYGEISGLAAKESQSRQGQQNDANSYLQAVQRATYQGLSPQFSQGLQQINSNIAGSGPLADSGYGNAMKARLAQQIYGAAQGQIGNQYSSYLGNLLNQRRQYGYQKSLMAYQRKLNRPNAGEIISGALGGLGGEFLGGYGQGLGSRRGGGGGGDWTQANDVTNA